MTSYFSTDRVHALSSDREKTDRQSPFLLIVIMTMLRMRPRALTSTLAASLLIAVQLVRTYSLDLTSEGKMLLHTKRHEPGCYVDVFGSVHQISRSGHDRRHDVFLHRKSAWPDSRVAPTTVLLWVATLP